MAELCEKLKEYKDSDYYQFHMPGQKRNGYMTEKILADVYGLDITEIDGFDNLHQAVGILKREQENFKLSRCAYRVDIQAQLCGKHVYFSLGLLKSMAGFGQAVYPLTASAAKAY